MAAARRTRHRLQTLVDQRYNRRRYDVEHMVRALGATLRDEVELHTVSPALLDAIERTVQPARASLWIRSRR